MEQINSCVLAVASDLLWSSGTEIVLGLFTLLSTCGWFVSGRKHRQEIESLKADNRQKDMNLSKDYVTEWRTYIAEPLQREVGELRTEIAHLRHAIQAIDACAHRDTCPVINELQRESHSDE